MEIHKYQLAPSSLVLGGYDEERCDFGQKNITKFDFADISAHPYEYLKVPSVTIRIGTANNSEILNAKLDNVLLDNATPFIWLPQMLTQQIAEVLNITLNTTSSLYSIPVRSQYKWRDQNNTLSFTIPDKSNLFQVNFTAPSYDWLQLASSPFHNFSTATWYLPIKALPHDQNTPVLGRSFFMRACLLADYERQTFSLTPQNPTWRYRKGIVPYSTGRVTINSSNTVPILAITLPIVLVLIVFMTYNLYLRQRLRRRPKKTVNSDQSSVDEDVYHKPELDGKPSLKALGEGPKEKDSNAVYEKDGTQIAETDGCPVSEIMVQSLPIELPGSLVNGVDANQQRGKG
jgi:hypothetical protein